MQFIRKEMYSLEELNRIKIDSLNRELNNQKTLAIVSGTVVSLSTILIAGSLVFGDGLQAIQTGGTAIAMGGYVYGYNKSKKLINKELELRKELKGIKKIKDRLEIVKIELEKLNNTKAMASTACTGFLINALAHIAELIMFADSSQYVPSIISILLSGTVAILDGWLIMSQNNKIELKEEEVKAFQQLSDLEDKYVRNASTEPVINGDIIEVSAEEPLLEESAQVLKLTQPKESLK